MSTCRPSIGVRDLRDADAVEQQVALAAQEVHGVGGERLDLDGEPGPGGLDRRLDRLRVELGALGDDVGRRRQTAPSCTPDGVALLDRGQNVRARRRR